LIAVRVAHMLGACVPACVRACVPACLPACLPARPPARPPARLPACLPARMLTHSRDVSSLGGRFTTVDAFVGVVMPAVEMVSAMGKTATPAQKVAGSALYTHMVDMLCV